MGKLKITQIKSTIDRLEKQKRTMIALGITKMNRSVEKEDNPAIRGMIRTVSHLIKVETV